MPDAGNIAGGHIAIAAPRPRARRSGVLRRLAGNKVALAGILLLGAMLLCIVLQPLVGTDPNAIDLLALNAPPNAAHWLGTDGVGRDVLARVLTGGALSLEIACGAAAISLAIGFLVAAVAALGGGAADAVTMRLVDLVMTLPPVVLLLVLASITGPGIGATVLVIGLLSWPVPARLIRSRLLELRERDFVVAAIGMGARLPHIMRRHALPNCVDILLVTATLQIAQNVLLEAGLSFLGLGVPPPAASWGNMLNAARSTAVLVQYPWEWLAPGGALLLTIMAINFTGDGLRTALDPRSTPRA
jgi:peptide/nickel transport system permease protein